jgi:hypothetical protein
MIIEVEIIRNDEEVVVWDIPRGTTLVAKVDRADGTTVVYLQPPSPRSIYVRKCMAKKSTGIRNLLREETYTAEELAVEEEPVVRALREGRATSPIPA